MRAQDKSGPLMGGRLMEGVIENETWQIERRGLFKSRMSKGKYFEKSLGYFRRENENLIVLLEHGLRSQSMA